MHDSAVTNTNPPPPPPPPRILACPREWRDFTQTKVGRKPRLSMKSCLLLSFALLATNEAFDHDSAKFLGATWGVG